MNFKTKKQQFIYSISIGVLTSIVIIILLFFGVNTIENRDNHRKKSETLEKFLRFQSEAESTINESINLLEGYLAYIETNPYISEEDTNRYLEKLLSKKITLIRNVGIIKDTTIIWNYPKKGNEKAIGVDIKTIPTQRDNVLKVKETLKGLFIGPINLVQGGVGFIARLPIVIEGKYWGQISIVLDGDKYLKYIDTIAKEVSLNVAIYNQENFPKTPFYGDNKIMNRNGLVLDITNFNNKWKVVIEPLDGWKEDGVKILILKSLAILISVIIGFFVYMILYTRYQLNYQAMNDQLTGLNNRYVLEYYYQTVLKKAEANDRLIGIFLMDINRFKKINDNYGHKVGDLVLIEFGKRLQSIRIKGKKVFRIGGDEFLIVVSEIHEMKDLEHVDKVIREESVFKFKHENIDIEVVPSIGLAVYPRDGDTLDRIMNIADTRMYEEKRLTKE
ncbi:diguanylate cyclase domain-containing protein [Haloimpatiens sp. FM7330]|uniref:diguanylate cyclase domain-containing protein n=1 Tax=Haloimpatiens sp. FM7330 TaxID=3298610 RepID=UPI00363CABFC